jgi:hypothetical protein
MVWSQFLRIGKMKCGCNNLNFKFLKFVKIMYSPKNLLGLHCMHNYFPEPSPILMFKRMSRFLFFKSKFRVRIQIPFVEFPYSLIWVLKSISKFYFKNIPNLDFKFIWSKSLTNVQIPIFWEYPKIWFEIIQISFLIHPNSNKKFENWFPIHFKHLAQFTKQSTSFPSLHAMPA